MRINFRKCGMVLLPINIDSDDAQIYAQIYAQSLSCRLGKFPLKHLRVPLHYSKLRKEDLQPMSDKIINRVVG